MALRFAVAFAGASVIAWGILVSDMLKVLATGVYVEEIVRNCCSSLSKDVVREALERVAEAGLYHKT